MFDRGVLERVYGIADWKDDPWTHEGRERYLKAIRKFKDLFKHPWLAGLLHGNLSVVDLGAGRGIGGVALVKAFEEKGVKTRLVMVDLRRDAVKDALRFAREEGVDAEAYVMDALEVYKLGKYDIVLMYGAILAHFDEWSLPRLFASAAEALKDNGVIVIEEMDRVNALFRGGLKEIIVENTDPEKLSLSVHVRYDPVTGSYYRMFTRLRDFETVTVPINFRSIAHIASTLWLFTKDVDIIPAGVGQLYFILGKEPRKAIGPLDLGEDPMVVKRGAVG